MVDCSPDTRPHLPHRRGLIALLALVPLFLPACRMREAGRPPEPILRLALDARDPLLQLPVYVAIRQRLFASERLRINVTEFPDSRQTTGALASGQFQLASSGFDQVLESAAKGRSFTAFGVLSRSPMLALISKSPLTRARLHSNRERTAVVASGDSTDLFARYVLPWQTVPEGSMEAAVAALKKREAGGAVVNAALLRALDAQSVPYVVFADTRTLAGLLNVYGVSIYPASCLYASASWINESRDRVQRIGKALRMALAWIQTHKADDLAPLLPEGSRDPALIDEVRPLFSQDGTMPADAADAVRRVLKMPQLPADSYTNDFVSR